MTVIVRMRVLRPGPKASYLLEKLNSQPKLSVRRERAAGSFDVEVSASTQNSARLEISATADLFEVEWHSLIDFDDRRPPP